MNEARWYEAWTYGERISSKIVVKESETMLSFIDGSRAAKQSERRTWFPTESEAIEHLRSILQSRYDTAKKSLEKFETTYPQVDT